MKAVVCKELCLPKDLVVTPFDLPAVPAGHVKVTVKSAALNFPDVLMVQGKYQYKPELPFVVGGDFAGVIAEIGEGVEGWTIGQRVYGSTVGSFAEECIAPAANIFASPDDIDDDTASCFAIVYGTVIHALKDRANIQPGETLLVLGASGGVGIGAIQLGKIMGARVIAAASTQEKLDLCREVGADEVINYDTENLRDRVKELTGGKGADVIFDPVGDRYFDAAINCIGFMGRYLVVGFAAGEIPKMAINRLLIKSASAVGVFWGFWRSKFPQQDAANFQQLAEWHSEGKWKVIVQKRVGLDDVPQALQDMADRKVMGKVIVDPSL
ncbi:MAG: NADPH2:quinone reductase [Gammaproteobacteria bacterium]|jgi:NADPH2:quinone reductase